MKRAIRSCSSGDISARYESRLASASAFVVCSRSMWTALKGRTSIRLFLRSPEPDHRYGNHHGAQRKANADLRAVLFHELRRLLTIQHREVALPKVANAAADDDGQAELHRRHRRGAGHQHEYLEWHRRW